MMKKRLAALVTIMASLCFSTLAFSGVALASPPAINHDSGKESIFSYDDCDIDYISRYDGTSVYLYTVTASIDKYDSDYGKAKNCAELVVTAFDEEEFDERDVMQFNMRGGQKYQVVLGSNNLNPGEDVTVSVWTDDYDVDVKYAIDRYSGYAEGIVLPERASIKTGQTKTLEPELNPIYSYSPYKWASSDERIATVDSFGVVTAKKAGECTVTATLSNGSTASCAINVTNPAPSLNYSSAWLYRGQKFKLKLSYPLGKVSFKSTNKSVATVTSTGTVQGKSFGKCSIEAKSKGKTYKCKVTVGRLNPNFGAYLKGYDTRNNIFTVKVKNWGKKPLYIKSGYGKAVDVDYKSYDRTLYLSNPVKLAPNSSATLKFKVQGSNTWYQYRDFTIYYKVTYDDKTYEWHTWDDDSSFKSNNKWWTTYWDKEQFANWLY